MISVETEFHIVSVEKREWQAIKDFCKEEGITPDYYFWEFAELDDLDWLTLLLHTHSFH